MTPDEKAELLRRCADDTNLVRIVEAGISVLEFHQAVALRAVENTKKARAELEAAKAALSDAIELAEEGWGYADEYYRAKWDFEGRLATLRKALGEEISDAVSPVSE